MNESADRSDPAIAERDDGRCVNCGADVGDEELTHWDLSDRAADELTVTLCPSCADLLRGERLDWRRRIDADPAEGIFAFLRSVTTTQGSAVADVATLATETIGGLEPDDPAARRRYFDHRRRIALRLAVVDRHLKAAGVDAAILDPIASEPDEEAPTVPAQDTFDGKAALGGTARSLPGKAVQAYGDVLAKATALQLRLRTITLLVETALSVDGTCHVCLEQTGSAEACPSCGTPVRDVSPWRDDDGSSEVVSLYGSITDRLESASATTTELTDLSASLASAIRE